MRSPLPLLALLTLAAASSAVTLSPVAISRYRQSTNLNTNTVGYGLTPVSPLTPPRTSASHTKGTTSRPGGMVEANNVFGWRAEFDLSAPQGSRLVGAILEARVTAANDARTQPVDLRHYVGTGTITSTRPTLSPVETFDAQNGTVVRADVLQFFGAGRYVGFDFSTVAPSSLGSTNLLTWAEPTLTLTYAPVPEPASFAALGLGAWGLLRRRARR